MNDRFAKALAIGIATVVLSQGLAKGEFTDSEAKSFFELEARLDPSKAHRYELLIKLFGKHDRYKDEWINAIENQRIVSHEAIPDLSGNRLAKSIPFGALTPEQVAARFRGLQRLDPKSKATVANLEKRYGKQPWYLPAEVRDIEKSGGEFSTPIDNPVFKTAKRDYEEAHPLATAYRGPLIRHNWTDVLSAEDRSQSGVSKVDDLVGASFSYTHDGKADSDTWSSVGALILPFDFHRAPKPNGDWLPADLMLAPSISVNRITTNGDPKGEVDQLFNRVGIFAEWVEPFISRIQLRAAAVYGTDTAFDGEMPGFEVDLEPSLLFYNGKLDQNGNPMECPFKIGFRNVLWHKAATTDEGGDTSLLDYQLRVWLHMEGGDVQDVGKAFAEVPGWFFRMGPTAQLRINFPEVLKGFSITAQYSYLSDVHSRSRLIPRATVVNGVIVDQGRHDSLFTLDATLAIYSDKAFNPNRKISLNANYTRGGLNFTKQDVDTATVGLSVLF